MEIFNPYTGHGLIQKGDDLFLDEISLRDLAKQLPTPFYLYNQSQLEKNIQEYKNQFQSPDFHTQVFYASKAFNIKAMLQLVNQAELGVDVVSAGELYTAVSVGFQKEHILVHGNNKSEAELEMALDQAGILVLDNPQECQRLISLAKAHPDKSLKILIRINPGIEAHTHKYIVTGHVDSKFGISLLNPEILIDMIEQLNEVENLEFIGFHCHIGSQILDLQAFEEEVKKLSEFCLAFQPKIETKITTLDLGGGFAVWYEDEMPPTIEEVCQRILTACSTYLKNKDLSVENIWIEPGRSLVANAGMQIYTIGDTKTTPNKTYYFIDGGMADNIRPALYQAIYSADILEQLNKPKTEMITLAGKACESGDILIEKARLPKARTGDHVIVFSTGAYGYAMASNYNKLPIPPVYFAKGNTVTEVVRAQSLGDLIRNEVLLEL